MQRKWGKGVSLRTIHVWLIITMLAISGIVVYSTYSLTSTFRRLADAAEQQNKLEKAAHELMDASDYLTESVQRFTLNGDIRFLEQYFTEAFESHRREEAISQMDLGPQTEPALKQLQEAMDNSVSLMDREYYAMRLVMEANGEDVNDADVPAAIKNVQLKEADSAAAPEDKIDTATELVFGEGYNESKGFIIGNIQAAIDILNEMLENNVVQSAYDLKVILVVQQVVIGVNVLFGVLLVGGMFVFLIRPVRIAVKKINGNEKVRVQGSKEYRYLAEAFNHFYDLNATTQERLSFEAEHDKLTGLYNRTGYDKIFSQVKLDKCAYVLLDIDKFKLINDSFGHASGDAALVRVGKALSKYFHSKNANVFRIGGDEFAVLLEGVSKNYEKAIIEKCNSVNKELEKAFEEFIPTMSFGVAFGEADDNTDTLFKKADEALYQAKKANKGNVSIFKTKDGKKSA